jgi:hypothetical protein
MFTKEMNMKEQQHREAIQRSILRREDKEFDPKQTDIKTIIDRVVNGQIEKTMYRRAAEAVIDDFNQFRIEMGLTDGFDINVVISMYLDQFNELQIQWILKAFEASGMDFDRKEVEDNENRFDSESA